MSSDAHDGTWSFSQAFTAEFQATRSDLESRIAAFTATPPTPADVEELATRLAKLSKSLSDASASLPTYDQKLYANQVKHLEIEIDKFRTAAKPKSRFAFKRTAPVAPPPIQSHSPVLGTPIEPTPGPKDSPPPRYASQSEGLELSKHASRYLTWADLPTPVTAGSAPDLAISNLSRCIVNLLPPKDSLTLTFSALHIRNLADCIVMLPFNEGSALIHDVSNCVLVLGCHQFRMHTSTNVDVYLKIASNPIIETCSKIRFATYPSHLAPQLLKEPPQPAFTVQDFSHIRATPSPNFSLIGGKLGIEVKPWPTSPIEDASEALANCLIGFLPETAASA